MLVVSFRYFAGLAMQPTGEENPVGADTLSITDRVPLGVCAAIAPSNYPLLLAVWKVAAALGVPLAEITRDAGVDVLSFGGTKNGLVGGEAVVFFDPAHARNFLYVRKQGMQLASKMRFVAAQFEALFTDDLWLRSAQHANAMAARLVAQIRDVPGVQITQRVDANAIFAILPAEAIPPLQAEAWFYVWDEARSEVRLMTSWDTTEEDVDRFAAALRRVVGTHS